MRRSPYPLCFGQPTIAKTEAGGDQTVKEDDFDADGNSQTDVAFHVRSSPSASAKTEEQKTDGYDQIAFDKSDQEVDRDHDVRNHNEQGGERKSKR